MPVVNQLIEQALDRGKVQAAVPGPRPDEGDGAPRCTDYLLARDEARRRWPPVLVRVWEDGRSSVAMTFDAETGRCIRLSTREAARLAGIPLEDVDLLSEGTVERRFEDLAVETILDDAPDDGLWRLLREGDEQ